MSQIVIRVEGVSKRYQLGSFGTGTIKEDLNRWWANLRGKKNYYFGIDESEHNNREEEYWALKDINFEIKQGEILGIIGKNGAGKSSLLKILSRITTPTAGEIKIRGRIASLLEVGTGFHPELTGKENIFLNGAILGMTKSEIKNKLDEIIAFSGVEKHIDTPIKRYSSGMYVRLAFAVAAHLEPEILIVDEVLAVGDAEFQKKCIGKMGQIAHDGRTILFVSHNMAAVNSLCKRGLLLNKGELLLNDSMEKVVNFYLNESDKGLVAQTNFEDVNQAPGNKNARILTIRIVNKNGVACSIVSISDVFYLEIIFENYVNGNLLTSNIQLYTQSGVGVLSTANWKSAISNVDQFSGIPLKKGKYRSKVKIPANFLNEGIYFANAILLQNSSNIVAFAKEAVVFNVIDSGEMRKEYLGDWLGVIRPKLVWTTNLE
ncbi:ABC transporter ATP-binding protein [Cyclobacterium jeungdonense]|uniref:ABC transporter ATP-binding protein n=1 Tax=Cyclobacterium jeungdonense TaxID=708087 RepID=A0ABT8CB73_9BACT|nr:ABC transporter ATP-binding protein [Cyclobacterium jeungdonense]MDN3688858.1 ABC transporter ATP-binding protein [Cyclobacterium jeungdonense]